MTSYSNGRRGSALVRFTHRVNWGREGKVGMKIGMIVEGSPGGADEKVYSYLAKQLRADIEVEAVALNNKPTLIEHCGVAAKALLEINKCEKVIIIWDYHPAWRKNRGKPCIVEDCSLIRDSLNDAGLSDKQLQCVQLVCIKHELETFLLADGRAIKKYLMSIKDKACRINPTCSPIRFFDRNLPTEPIPSWQ
jgi:hypothetical protein